MATLGSIAVGTVVKIKEGDNQYWNYIVIDQKYGTVECSLLMREDIAELNWYNYTANVNFSTEIESKSYQLRYYITDFDENNTPWLNSKFGKAINLSATELGSADSNHLTEGEPIEYFKNGGDKKANYLGRAKEWWTRTRHSSYDREYDYFVNTEGEIELQYNTAADVKYYGIRPVIALPWNMWVTSENIVTVNNPPEINLVNSPGDVPVNKPFTLIYTVTDEDNDTVSVKEFINSLEKRSFTPQLGAENSINIADEEFLTMLNGENTIEIMAADGKEEICETVAFTKEVNGCSITLKNPLVYEKAVTGVIVYPVSSVSKEAEYKFMVTNNALDVDPVWEDATRESQNKIAYYFKNETAVKGNAFNFKLTAEKGNDGLGGYVNSIQGTVLTK